MEVQVNMTIWASDGLSFQSFLAVPTSFRSCGSFQERFPVPNLQGWNAVKWISILSLMRKATFLRKLEKIPLSEEKFGRLHFFQPPRTHKSKTFLHSLPGGFAPPLPHPFGHESPRGVIAKVLHLSCHRLAKLLRKSISAIPYIP